MATGPFNTLPPLGSVKPPTPPPSGGSGLGGFFGSLSSRDLQTLGGVGKGLAGGIQGLSNASLSKQLAEINAQKFFENAKAVEFQGRENIVDLERARGILQGKQRAISAASGVVASSGSALNITVDTARGFARAKVRSEFATYVQIESLNYQAAISRYQGKVQAHNQTMKAVSSFISAGTTLAGAFI